MRAPVHTEYRWTLKTLNKSVQHALYDSVYTKFPGKKNPQRHEVDWWFPGNAGKFNEKELLVGIGFLLE